jgi:hypothetical protein
MKGIVPDMSGTCGRNSRLDRSIRVFAALDAVEEVARVGDRAVLKALFS